MAEEHRVPFGTKVHVKGQFEGEADRLILPR
jgi:hypothetical protein